MRSGSIVQLDTPEQVFHSPADRFVGAFMGEADFLTAASVRDDLGSPLDGVAETAAVMLRPDDVTFVEEPTGDAIVVSAEFRGSNWCYALQLASGATVHALRSHITPTAIGATVAARVTPGHCPVVLPN
jgi:iron(III) transport system ATP-binding protein